MATAAPSPRLPRSITLRIGTVNSDWGYGALLAALITWVAVEANGGLRTGSMTTVEIVLDLLSGLAAAVAMLVVTTRRPNLPGVVAASAFAAYVVFTAISTIWSVAPDQSWLEANRLVAYLAAFSGGMALVRLAPQRWTALLVGITLGAFAISVYALMHKMFP